jgi:hypothetical protein
MLSSPFDARISSGSSKIEITLRKPRADSHPDGLWTINANRRKRPGDQSMNQVFRNSVQVLVNLGRFSGVCLAIAFSFFIGFFAARIDDLHRQLAASRLERLSWVALVLVSGNGH